ncbi:MAG: hypothetical protein AAFY51_02770 [Pseudomonadota bacterium]
MAILLEPSPVFESGIAGPTDSARLIVRFLEWVDKLFQAVRTHTPSFEEDDYFENGFGELFGPAYDEFTEQRQVQIAEALVLERSSALERHGLTGDQLNLKLVAVRHWVEKYIADPSPNLFFRILSPINTLLKSILDAVGASTAFKELKEALENWRKDIIG